MKKASKAKKNSVKISSLPEENQETGTSNKKKRRSLVSTISASLLSDDKNGGSSIKEKMTTDVIRQVLKGARNSRTEIANKVGGEVTRLLKKIDISSEIRKILAENRIRISAEIEFVPKKKTRDEGRKPESEEISDGVS